MNCRTNKKNPIYRGRFVENSMIFRMCSSWLGMRDSNPRMTGPEPVALPLGQSPVQGRIILGSAIFLKP